MLGPRHDRRRDRHLPGHRHQPPGARAEGRRALHHPHGVRPAVHRRAQGRPGGGAPGAGQRRHGLLGEPGAEGAPRPPLPRDLWRRGGGGPVHPHLRSLARLGARLEFKLFAGGSGGVGAPGLCRLSQRPEGAAHSAGGDRLRGGGPLSTHRRGAGRPRSGSGGGDHRQSGQSHRHHPRARADGGDRRGLPRAEHPHQSPTKSITA